MDTSALGRLVSLGLGANTGSLARRRVSRLLQPLQAGCLRSVTPSCATARRLSEREEEGSICASEA